MQNKACSTLTVFTDSHSAGDRPTRESVSSWVIMLDGFLSSAGARTQSVIVQSSCEAEYIAATAATSEAMYIHALFLACERPARKFESVPGPENVADADTKPADKRSLEFCRSKMGVTEIPKQFRDAVLQKVHHNFRVSVSSFKG